MNLIKFEINNKSNLDISATIESPIFINGTATGIGAQNWTWAKNQTWCTGEGIIGDPYRIENIIIDGNDMGSCITIVNSNAHLIIENCSFTSSGILQTNAGIEMINVGNTIIMNSSISRNGNYGIYLNNCINVTIEDNNIKINKKHGVYVEYSKDINLKWNKINYNGNFYSDILDDGIHLYYTNQSNVQENNLSFNADDGVEIYYSLNTGIFKNTIYNNRSIRSINTLHMSGVSTFTSNYTKIRNNDIYDVTQGISTGHYHSIIENNNISLINAFGIKIGSGYNHSIRNNYLQDIGDRGIYISTGNKSIVEGNIIDYVVNYGIEILMDNCTIYNNTISHSVRAINLKITGFCNISYNKMMSNGYGIYFYSNGHDYIIEGNNMTNCGIGIQNRPYLDFLTSFNIDLSNKVNEKTIYSYYNTSNLDNSDFLTNGAPGQIILVNCNDTIITDFEITNSSHAISLFFCNNASIMNCNLSYNSQSGILKYGATDYKNKIVNNTLSFNSLDGITSWSSGNPTIIEGNYIENNTEQGINIEGGTSYIIYNNTIRYNGINGIFINAGINNISLNKIIGNRENGIYNRGAESNITSNTISYNNQSGIYNGNANNNSIVSNIISNNLEYGINIFNSPYSSFSYNNLSNNNYGVRIISGMDCIFNDNNIENSSNGIQIEFDNDGLIISNNSLINSDITFAEDIGEISNLIIPLTNTINEKLVYWYSDKNFLSSDNFTFKGFPGKIILANCNYSTIDNVNLLNGAGITLLLCSNITIQNCEIINNINDGIYCIFSQDIDIMNNTINNNFGNGISYINTDIDIFGNIISNNSKIGIKGDGEYSRIIDNNIIYNEEYGISLLVRNIELNYNNISYNKELGIYLYYIDEGIILNNSISFNGQYGMLLSQSYKLYIQENDLFYNDIGIIIYGSSSNNTIYLNNFIGNIINAVDNSSNNYWDNGSIGNYWDDYNGIDLDNNGIGDTPYNISGSANAVDNFPIILKEITKISDNLVILIIPLIIITGLIGIVIVEYFISDILKKKKVKKSIKEPILDGTTLELIDDFNIISQSEDKTFEAMLKTMPDLKNYIESNKMIKDVPKIHNYMTGIIDSSLFGKIELLDLSLEEKGRFIKELLNLDSKERIKLIDEMLENKE